MVEIRPHMTAARRAWLENLRDDGPQTRNGRGVAGFQCMQLGWTSWLYRRGDETAIKAELQKVYDIGKPGWMARAFNDGWSLDGKLQVITPAGRRALANSEDGQ